MFALTYSYKIEALQQHWS